jgi:hypothetical protein
MTGPDAATRRALRGTRAGWRIALLLAFAITTRLGAQDTSEVTTEFFGAKNQTLVRMGKLSLDSENQLGAFYSFAGRAQQAPVPELTLHFVRSGAQWAYAYDYNVVVVLDDKTRMPLPRARRSTSVGEGYMLEQIFIPVSREQAARIAQARKVQMNVGTKAFVWTDSLQQAFRQMSALAGGSGG